MTHVEVIDLGGVANREALLQLLGERLELGGPDGNFPVGAADGMAGWGMNWDALADALCCLDSGGIWGNSRKLPFPLFLCFENVETLRREDPQAFGVLVEILEMTKLVYGRSDMSFEYALGRS